MHGKRKHKNENYIKEFIIYLWYRQKPFRTAYGS